MSIKVYGGRMGTSFRVHWALTELGIPYEEGKLDMAAGEHKSEWYLKINPAGQVPCIVKDDDWSLAESLAINSYFVDTASSELAGTTPEERAKVWQWALWATINLYPHFTTLASPNWTGQELAPEVAAKAKETIEKHLPIWEFRMGTRAYTIGERFTIADINIAAIFEYAAGGRFDHSGYPNTNAWLERVRARPSYAAAKGQK